MQKIVENSKINLMPPPPPPRIVKCFLGIIIISSLFLACKKDDEPMNAAPTIEAQTFSIAESAGVDAAVGTVAATDDDALTFAITEVSRSDAFAINASTGAITVAGALDYETAAAYTLTVQVSDGSLTADAEITINVTDVNEAPVITAQTAPFMIEENAAEGTAVGTVAATDEDEGDDDLTFAVTNGNTNEAFQIDNMGAITVKTPAALDFETTPTFTLTVQVSDDENLSSDAEITVNLTDVAGNEAPIIAAQTFSVEENAANGAAVGTVVATDAEGDNLTFAILSGNTSNAFAISAGTGVITVEGTIDYETTPTYTLTVQVSDGMTLATAAITINVTNVNDNAPTIATQIFSVAENAANGAAVGTVMATDADGDNLTFTIINGNTGSTFAINASSGAITVAGTLDRATTQTYTLTVQVSDGTTSAEAAVTINVTDTGGNEAPTIAAQTFSIPEDAAVNTSVGTVMAMDADGDNLIFTITSGNTTGNTSDAFAINAGTGAITVAGTLDHETTPTYTLTVQVSDGTATANAAATINVADVNEAPVVTAQTTAFTVAEDANNGTTVGTVAATDPENEPLTFAITNGNTGNAFAINASSGAITVARTLDHETTPTYTLTVRVSDGSLSGTADFTVNVTDVNEAPIVTAQSSAFTVAENANNGTAVGTVAATDPENDRLTFSITAGNTGNAFAINGTGAITVAGTLDHETTPTYTLTVRAADASLSDMANFTVNVTDVNEAPMVTAQNAAFTVAENAANGTTVGTVAATDPESDRLTFSITAGNTGNAFAINASSGVITVAGTVDYETTPTYTLTVRASDGSLSSTANFTVNVTNVNDNTPTIAAQTLSVAENSAAGTTVGTVAATDADGDPLTFSITAGNTGDAFQIANSGVITVKTVAPLDFETMPTFMLTVQVSDGMTSVDATITINVTNVNESGKRLTDKDIKADTLRNAGNTRLLGLWSDRTTMWVVNNANGESSSDKIFAYTLADGSRDADKDIETLNAAGNNVPIGIWSNGTTLWVSDLVDDKLYAYTLSNGSRDASKDINLDDANSSPLGLWSDGTTIWVVNNKDTGEGDPNTDEDKIFAYTLADGSRDAAKDINTLNNANNNSPTDLWSNGTILWVSDRGNSSGGLSRIYAYTLSNGTRNAGKDIDQGRAVTPRGMWSNGTTLWINDNSFRILAYQLE